METTRDLLERVRATCTPPTYYRASKALGVTRQAVSNWKAGREKLSEEAAERVALVLKIELGYVLACVAAERTQRPAVRRAWEKVAQGLAAVLLGAGLAGSPPSTDAGSIEHNTWQVIHYATRRRLLAWLLGPKLAL